MQEIIARGEDKRVRGKWEEKSCGESTTKLSFLDVDASVSPPLTSWRTATYFVLAEIPHTSLWVRSALAARRVPID